MSSDRLHPVAAVGFGRGVDAYERGRPSFPAEAVVFLTERLSLRPGRTLLELGPGTGKLTRLLAPTGARIVAVEPVAAMRDALRRETPTTVIIGGVAEAVPLTDGSVDAAVAAQAFHWFDPDRAIGELSRLMPPGAPLGMVWNVRDERAAWVEALSELIEPYRGDTPSHRRARWKDAFGRSDTFTPPALRSFPYHHRTTGEGVVDRILSISFIAALPEHERQTVADDVRKIVPAEGGIEFPYRTDVWVCSRAGGASATMA
jgi:SAM-dependent methyltransferase